MAKVRKQRAKVASPSEVISTTVGLLTPQEGQEIKSTVIKYKNLQQGGKLKEAVDEYLLKLMTYHTARYNLQRQGYNLQTLLDEPLVKAGELSRNNHWKFSLKNKQNATREKEGVTETYIVAADIYCVDTPDEDFTKKLEAYLPRERADELELGFLNLGDINEPKLQSLIPDEGPSDDASEEPYGMSEGTDEDTEDTEERTIRRGGVLGKPRRNA